MPDVLETKSGLLEREPFFVRLESAHEHALAGHGRLVFVEDEAGAGKTALVRHFCERHSDRSRLLWGGCDALFTPRPLGPMLDIAQGAGPEFSDLVLGRAIPFHVAAAAIEELATSLGVWAHARWRQWAHSACASEARNPFRAARGRPRARIPPA